MEKQIIEDWLKQNGDPNIERIVELEAELISYRSLLDDATKENSNLQLYKNLLEDSRIVIRQLQDENRDLRGKSEIIPSLELDRNVYKSLTERYVEQIKELNSTLYDVEDQLKKANQTIEELKYEISDLEYDLEEANDKIDEYGYYEDDVDDLKQEVRVLENKLEETSIPELEFDHINGAYLRTTFTELLDKLLSIILIFS